MSDTPFEVPFASITSQAAEMMDADTAPPIGSDAPVAVSAAPVVAAPVKDAPAEVIAALPAADELDPETQGDRLVKVKVDGVWEVKPLKDVAAGYSRTSHFTRQMQDLATQRKSMEDTRGQFDQLVAERTQIQAFLRNPELVYKFLKDSNPELFQAAQQTIQGDPNEIATVQQAQDLVNKQAETIQQTLARMEASMNEKLSAATRDIENRRETVVYAESINSTVKDIFEKNPILHKMRMSEDIMRFEVSKMNPQTITEANDAFRTVAQGMVEDLNDGFAASTKTKTATAAKLATSRIEPPGGSGPQIQPTNYKREDGTLDWTKLRKAAQQFED